MIRTLTLCLALSALSLAQAAPANEPSEPIKAARKLMNDGKHDEALAAFGKIATADPKNWDAHLGIGAVLDLKGQYAEARKHIQQGIDLAPSDLKPSAWRTMAMSYAFERNGKEVEAYEKFVYDYRLQKNDVTAAAEVANELARILLESGDLNGAEKWYRLGHENALKNKDLTAKEQDLWEFRWASAQARIAARRGNKPEADKQARAATKILSSGSNPEQAPYGPYVTGYVAYYGGDYATAIAEFLKTNQNDPFNQVMLAQAYEKQGNKAKAAEYYQKVLASNAHNPTNAYARPIAQKKVKAKS